MSKYQNILLALPTVSMSMKSGTALSVAHIIKSLQAAGVDVDLHNIDSAEIVTARDMFANMVLHSDKWDSLLFIDSDMAFRPELILKMVNFGADVMAAACPRRSLSLERLIAGMQEHGQLRRALAQASDFTVKMDWDGQQASPMHVERGFCSAAAVGMACALISRDALIAMVEKEVVKPRPDLRDTKGRTCWSFFGIVEANGQRFGEDYSFCYRWTALMKNELWVCVDEEVSHIGHFSYTARYADLL